MAVDRRVVIGRYDNQDEVANEVRRLVDLGYPKNKITVYTDNNHASHFRNTPGVDVKTEDTGQPSTQESDDRSVWEQIKDAFSSDTYDYDEVSERPEYTHDDDVLYPYRDDIAAGKAVIVVEDFREDTDTNETMHDTSPTITDTDDDRREIPPNVGNPSEGNHEIPPRVTNRKPDQIDNELNA